jgi:hypothetical protein
LYTHEDLVANAGKTRRSDNNGIDDDGNECLLMFMDGILQKQQYCFDGVDDDHGTHVAELLALWGEWKRLLELYGMLKC